ncbi:MAG: hypothetical protein F4Y41_07190, partial [Gammaproteobacteria bacterium]|nr:hypothetical protein [Gammaproteobacteria bacterium]
MTISVPDFGTPPVVRYAEPARRLDANGNGATPVANGVEYVDVTIDGAPIRVAAGTSIMRAAREAGLDIPKLCATDN